MWTYVVIGFRDGVLHLWGWRYLGVRRRAKLLGTHVEKNERVQSLRGASLVVQRLIEVLTAQGCVVRIQGVRSGEWRGWVYEPGWVGWGPYCIRVNTSLCEVDDTCG